jgi:CBS-domain-containing membrane protein
VNGRPTGTALRAAALLVVSGLVAWATGLPALFPSLGPTAYVLALRPDAPESRPRRVLGGHALGVIAGLACYALLAAGTTVAAPPPAGSTAGLRLTVAGVVSVGLTTGAMLATDLRHAPACATTLIVSLGLLSTPHEGLLVVGSVAALVAVHRLAGLVGDRVPARPLTTSSR